MKRSLIFLSLLGLSGYVFSEDIELYFIDSELQEETKPQVLLMVDTSGSMSSNQTIKTPFDSSQQYQYLDNFSDRTTSYLYYSVGADSDVPSVDSPTENRRFKAILNNCSTATSRLNSAGFYTGRIREYTFEGNVGSWQEISGSDGQSITIIDCEDDINLDSENQANNVAAEHNVNTVNNTTVYGYPVDGLGSSLLPIYYHANVDVADTTWSGDVVTLYTDKYLRWEQGTQLIDGSDIGTTSESRLNIAKRTLSNLIDSIPSVNFGLEVYNFNNGSDNDDAGPQGGRIAFGIQEMNATAKGNLLNIINNDMHASGWTPLCESYYEAYRYFAGLPVKYGKQDIDGDNGNKFHDHTLPDRDTSVESGANYVAPYSGCSDKIFVILITDGSPTIDNAADTFVQSLKANAETPLGDDIVAVNGNSLPILSAYMNTNDINANLEGTQTAQLYTIGFSGGAASAENLLQAAATNGGGVYYDATDVSKLGSSLQDALISILSVDTSFTAPSVATNSFDRTETLDSAYFAMFTPSDRARWDGNLKKLKIVGDELQDREGNVATNGVDEENPGSIKASAKTFWSTSTAADGNDVTQGGVVEMFTNKQTARDVYSDIGTSSALSQLTHDNLTSHLTDEESVNTLLGVSSTEEAKEYLSWALGIDDVSAGDDPVYTYRTNLFGDPLHSQPLAINYGGTEQDIRIVVGTNAGVLHMFKDSGDTVDESWAFMPKEFFSNIKTLRDNLPSSSKVYGIDGNITSHVVDKNGDGIINQDTDTAWIFFGLRRGGNSYYGLDVTNPDAPELLWKIEANSADFKELGQTWSQPEVGYSSINISAGEVKPVLVFGAGYSTAKDISGPGSESDSTGRGIYMVDAETGTLLWSATPEATSAKNTQFTGFTDSIPSKIATLDSDGDGLIDRLYTGDTGGNVFRVDMPGNDSDSPDTPWTVYKLAELGGASESPKTNENDRRFFDAPSIVRTFFTNTVQSSIDVTQYISQEVPYEAILLGSGDRSTPKSTDTNDEFFMIQDENVITQSFVAGAVAPAEDIPIAITYDDLFDFTSNPYGASLTEAQLRDLNIAVGEKSGWRYNFQGAGEKSTAGAIVSNGTVFFSSFQPGETSGDNVCQITEGQGSLYAIDLYQGTAIFDNAKYFDQLSTPPVTPVIISRTSTSTTDDDDPDDPSAPPGIAENTLSLFTPLLVPLDDTLKTSRSYQYVTENQ